MKLKSHHLITCLLAFLVSTSSLFGQDNHIIKGVVTDVSGVPMIGVQVSVKGTNNSSISDLQGFFSINTSNENPILVFTYMGYVSKEIKVKGLKTLKVVMEEDVTNLSEVQVIGYGQQKKVTITGAVTSISSKDLLKSPAPNVGNILAGSISGISTIQYSGQPGADNPEIYVRGIGTLNTAGASPLIMVDGVERSFFNLDPNEIESISVLKDASATAVFGVRGANGVILVTTKRGQEGKPKVSLTTSFGIQNPTKMRKLADSYEWASFYNESFTNDGKPALFSSSALDAFKNNTNPILYPNVDWMKLLFRDYAPQSQQNINISGGTKSVRYFTSLGYLDQVGMFNNLDTRYNGNYTYDRYNFRTNLDIDFSKTTQMKINLGGRSEIRNQPIVDDQTQLFRSIYWANPFSSAGIVDGKWVTANSKYIPAETIGNDGLGSYYGKGFQNITTNVLNIDLELVQKLDFLTQGLSFKIKGSYNSTYNHQKNRATSIQNYTPWLLKDITWINNVPAADMNNLVLVKNGDAGVISYNEGFSKARDWYTETSLNYARNFQNHHVTGLLLYNQSRSYYPATFPEIPTGYVGLVGRITYDYNTKYMVDVNMGYNGSENFAKDRRFGLFPSISGAWNVTYEDFMKSQQVFDMLKLRASYGIVGNDKIGADRFLYLPNSYVSGTGYNFGVNVPTNLGGMQEGKIGNPYLTWETAYKQNYGLDMAFLKNRLSATIDVFFEHRTGILATRQTVPAYFAMNLPAINLGIVDNKGAELTLNWKDKIDKFNYYVNVNLSYNKNKIVYMDEAKSPYPYQWQTGKSVGQQFGLQFIGFYYPGMTDNGKPLATQSGTLKPGDCVYRDLNHDGVIDGNDNTAIGYSNYPNLNGGATFGFDYKGFSFSMLWVGATMVSRLLEETLRTPLGDTNNRSLMQYQYDNRWTPETAATASLPRASFDSKTNNYLTSSLWIKDASYLRLKDIEIAQILNFPFVKSIGMSQLRVFVNAYNLLTFSKFDFADPESQTNARPTYPTVKIFNLGINATF
jgi:TonB-linked SusC/RagA family outer membrane protein